MPKSLVPAKKWPTQTARPTRSGSVTGSTVKKDKIKTKVAAGVSKPGNKPLAKKALESKTEKAKVKKPAAKKEPKEKKKVVIKKVKITAKKPDPGKRKKKVAAAPKKPDKSEKTEKPNVKKEKGDSNTVKEPVEVVIHVKKPKAKLAPKNEPKAGVASGKVKKAKIAKTTQKKKEILKKLSGTMDEELESVVDTILEVAVVKKVHSRIKPDESQKDKKKPKEAAKKKAKETKDVKRDPTKIVIKDEVVYEVEIPETEKEVVKEPVVVSKPEGKVEKKEVKVQVKELNDEDIRKMEIKKEIIDEFIEEEEKQSKAKFERKRLPFLKKPKLKRLETVKRKEEDDQIEIKSQQNEKKDEIDVKDVSKPSSTSNEGEKSSKKEELVKNKLKAKSTKGKKGSNNDKSDNEEKLPEDKDDDIMDEEQKAKRMKLYGFWTGPKRHRVASLNAIAKVHCLYENESRGAMNEMLDKSIFRGRIDRRKNQRKNYKESESDEKKESDDSVQEIPKRSLRTAPGMRGVGRHYDVETSSSSAPSSTSSESESEDEKPIKRPPSPKPEVKKQKEIVPKGKVGKEKKEDTKEKVVEETTQEEPVKKVRKTRRRCELMMDLKDMVVRKRMASLNASAMLAATYSVEKRPVKSDDDRRKKSAMSTTTDSTQSSTEVEPESSDEEVILSGSSKKVAVIVNQDTDVTITGLYVNSTTRSTRHCSITGMQYRISSTSHTQTESTAVTTETVIHTTDHVSVSHSSSSSAEAVGSPSGSCKSYTPLGALSSMQPPGNSSPLMRRHPCSTSAFSAPPPYHQHQDMHGYYQPAGPLISHHYHAAASSSTSLPAVSAPPAASSKGSPGPEQTSRPGDPPSEPTPPQEYRPPPFASAGYPPPPHNYYSYLQPPYQECYSPYLKYPAHPGFRRDFWPGHGPGPGGSTSGGPMVTSDPYHGSPPGPGGPIEPFPHTVAQPPPQPYYYPHAAPPACYTHPAPLRAPMFMSDPSYQTCPCPTMSSFPKNVLTGPLTGASKGSVQQQAQNSAQMSQQTTTGLSSSEQQAQQQAVQQQGLSVPAATQPASSMPNVALALSLETNNPHHGPPSPARGSAGLPPPASPALSTARNPPSWSPPNIIETEPTKETKTREEIRPAEPSPPPPQTLVVESPPVLENQLQVAQRRSRPPKRKPSIERQVSSVVVEENVAEPEKPLSVPEPSPEVVPKRRRSVTPVRSKSEPVKQPPISTRGQTKKPADKPPSANPEKKPTLVQSEALKPVTNGIPKTVTNSVAKPTPKIMDGALDKKVNGIVQKQGPLPKNGTSKTICQMGVQKMLLKNCSKTQPPTVAMKMAGARTKKENSKAKVIKSEPKKSGKKSACKDSMLHANPARSHLNGLKWSNGWSWEGEGFKARVFLAGDDNPVFRRCYPAMRHIEGDIIYPMDCILLRSGPRKQQLPFIAKVASLWENPDDGEMMVSLLWYYRPEHTDLGREPFQPDDEVFASRHRDTNSVACIEDKCYVLTFNEYCRYKTSLCAAEFDTSTDKRRVVPQLDYYPRSRRLPTGRIASELLFFCRNVYDFRTKKLLKKPY